MGVLVPEKAGDETLRLSVDCSVKMEQYYYMYLVRLKKLRPLQDIAKWKVPEDDILPSVSDIANTEQGREIVLTGVVVKPTSKIPTVFQCGSILMDKHLVADPLEGQGVYIEEKDGQEVVLLEDHTSWVKLHGINSSVLSTGMVISVKGCINHQNVFLVDDYTSCRIDAPVPREGNARIGFLSGSLPSDRDMMCRLVGHIQEQKITKLIVCGNSVGTDVARYDDIDMFFQVLLKINCAVEVMSGQFDPTTGMLPYAPISKIFFPKACMESKLFLPRANPCTFEEGGAIFLGTSGENVIDFRRHTRIGALDALETILRSRHIAPTSPDTLPAIPRTEDDVLLLDSIPHVFFAGNQEAFETRVVEGVHIVCVPAFASQPGVTVVETGPMEWKFVPIV